MHGAAAVQRSGSGPVIGYKAKAILTSVLLIERILELGRTGVVRASHVTEFSLASAADALGESAARHLKRNLMLKVR